MSKEDSIVIKGLEKSFGKLKVLEGIDLKVKKGEILALLGPNGAGKTTTVRIMSTLLEPDAGTISINGHDVMKHPNAVRSSIGLTGQYAAVDEYLSAEENLRMMGRLYRMKRDVYEKRTKELLEQFDLVDAAKRAVKTYSGGMRRRLDLAMSLIASPPVLFLDEPTTGLDPQSRLTLWDIIRKLAATDVTILLTTQHMEEADILADQIVVIDHGRVIAQGTPDELKSKVGSDRIELSISEKSDFQKALSSIHGEDLHSDPKHRTISVATKGGMDDLKKVLNTLSDAGIEVEGLSLHRPTLDDVFLSLTHHKATENGTNSRS